jgi:hypothetical protein
VAARLLSVGQHQKFLDGGDWIVFLSLAYGLGFIFTYEAEAVLMHRLVFLTGLAQIHKIPTVQSKCKIGP